MVILQSDFHIKLLVRRLARGNFRELAARCGRGGGHLDLYRFVCYLGSRRLLHITTEGCTVMRITSSWSTAP